MLQNTLQLCIPAIQLILDKYSPEVFQSNRLCKNEKKNNWQRNRASEYFWNYEFGIEFIGMMLHSSNNHTFLWTFNLIKNCEVKANNLGFNTFNFFLKVRLVTAAKKFDKMFVNSKQVLKLLFKPSRKKPGQQTIICKKLKHFSLISCSKMKKK